MKEYQREALEEMARINQETGQYPSASLSNDLLCAKSNSVSLSADLRKCRADRPDEWSMDRFIRKAEKLERVLFEASEQIYDNSILDKLIEDALDGA